MKQGRHRRNKSTGSRIGQQQLSSQKAKAEEVWCGPIERLAWGGLGVTREADGKLLLLSAPLALFPGEVVEANVVRKARHGEGHVRLWQTTDPRRVLPVCEVASACGGCELWGAGEAVAELKQQMVADLLHRQLPDQPWQWRSAPAWAKRHRIQLHWDGAKLGFHRRKSHAVVVVQACPAAAPCLSEAIPRLAEALEARLLPSRPQRWELSTGTPAGEVFATTDGGRAWCLAPDGWQSVQTPVLSHTQGDLRLDHTAGGFFQPCAPWAMRAFADVLLRWEVAGETLFDLYGGVGLFSALLGRRFKSGVLVEAAPASVAWAKQNLSALGLAVDCIAEDVWKWLPEALGRRADWLVLDPPRAGLDPGVVDKLNTARAANMVLVGCDGAAFCRDVKRLSGWRLRALEVLDLFPLTTHAEFVGWLEKDG